MIDLDGPPAKELLEMFRRAVEGRQPLVRHASSQVNTVPEYSRARQRLPHR